MYQPVKKSYFFILIIYLHNKSGYVICCKINLKTMTLGNIDNWFSSTLSSLNLNSFLIIDNCKHWKLKMYIFKKSSISLNDVCTYKVYR